MNYKRENRIRQALNIRNMKQIELCEKTGIKKSSVNGWIKQNWQPKQDSLYKMAKVLDVSEMWLAGYDVPMERTKSIKNTDIALPKDDSTILMDKIKDNENYSRLVNLFNYILELNPDQLNTIESMVNQLVKINK